MVIRRRSSSLFFTTQTFESLPLKKPFHFFEGVSPTKFVGMLGLNTTVGLSYYHIFHWRKGP